MRTVALLMNIGKIYGGAERRLARILKGISKDHFRRIFVFTGEAENVEKFVSDEALSCIDYYVCSNKFDIVKVVYLNRIDCLWFFNINHDAFFISWLPYHPKLIMTVANISLSRFMFSHKKQKFAFKILCKKSSSVDCLYPASIRLFRENNISNIHLTPCPFTNTDVFFPKRKRKEIVFASRLVDGKNVDKALEAIEIVKDFLIQYGYCVGIYGEGKMKSYVLDYILEHNLSKVVTYYGQVNLKEVFPYSSIYLSLQSLTNYPSQALIEAITCGNYVIATDTIDTDRIVKKEFGCLVSLDARKISDALRDAMEVVENNQSMIVDKCERFAKENFNKKLSIEYFSELIKNCCD